MNSVMTEFLLFHSTTWLKYGNTILGFCQSAFYPVFVFSLIYDKASRGPAPMQILKRLVIAQLVLISVPIYYKDVAGFGMKVGDELLREQKNGLIGNWFKIKERAEREVKKQKAKNKDRSNMASFGVIDTVASFLSFDGMNPVEKGAALLIFCCVLLIKIIYSVVYYSTYSIIGFLAVLFIFPLFDSYLVGALKSTLYLIITAILVALVLTFMNEMIVFTVNQDGFISGMEGFAKFLVLCFVLLGTLAIGFFIVNGKGAESWAGRMGTMLSGGLAYKTMNLASSSIKQGASGVGAVGKMVASPVGGMMATGAGTLAYMASRPIASTASALGKSLKEHVSNKVQNSKNLKSRSNHGQYLSNGSSNLSNGSTDGVKSSNPVIKGRYESSLNRYISKSDGSVSPVKALNPINHLKASGSATVGMVGEAKNRVKSSLGLPSYSSQLSMKEKAYFTADKMINRGEQTKNAIIANRIAKNLENRK